MKKIVAIGGGENGRPGYPYETAEIDKEIVKLSGVEKAKLLFIGTASKDHPGYFECIKQIFEKILNCEVDVLKTIDETPSFEETKTKILSSDIIYVGGGNTRFMLKKWKELGIDSLLEAAYNNGTVLSGLSAGSACWFKYCSSDSDIMDGISDEYILLECLGLIDALHCPHYDAEEGRRESLKKLMLKIEEPLVAIAIDNCAAIKIVDEKYKIISSKDSAHAYRCYWHKDKYYEELIPKNETFNLDDLIKHPGLKNSEAI